MRTLLSSYRGIFPIVLCNGYVGIGKRKENKKDLPSFFSTFFHPSKKDVVWDAFSPSSFFQPKYYYKYSPHKFSNKPLPADSPTTFPSNESLESAIEKFLQQKENLLEKVVLAKTLTYSLKEDTNPYDIICQLTNHFNSDEVYVYAPDKDHIFFGASPENLYRREKRDITVDAIAGTAEEERLLYTKKNINEHAFVTKSIETSLNKLCTEMHVSKTKTKDAKHLFHLHQEVHGLLQAGVTDFDIIKSLHPTPATLGFSKDTAMKFIEANEEFSRGLYTGCLGWIGKDTSCVKVAIRCCLKRKTSLTFFAGAGITKESIPKDEVYEMNSKLKTMQEVFLEQTM